MIEDIKVTIVCITYKHENYIAQALDSFLMQKTNFRYQIFVGEDCGPDRTADIVREYAEKYPDIVIPFIREKNMGAQRNLIDLCSRASSPYIAFCEGDDYWTDENKLQKQYDFMEANPELRVCFAKAEIMAPEDWFLRSYFKPINGKLIWPDSDPEYKGVGIKSRAGSFINMYAAHTSTVFYRWNYDLVIPEWYYEGVIGDMSIFLMQLGDGLAGFIPEVMTVYRRSDVGVYMSSSMDEHFMKTRIDLVRVYVGMLDFYEKNGIKNYPKIVIENRLKWQVNLLIRTSMKVKDYSVVQQLIEKYPRAVEIAFNAFLNFYNDSLRMSAVYSWEGNKLVCRNRYFMHAFAPFVKFILKARKKKAKWKKKVVDFLVYWAKVMGYWAYSLVPKQKNLWAFSGFYKRGYMDNIKYFYEYILEHHPEIEPVWFTRDNNVYKKLQEEGKPVYKMNSWKGTLMMAKAQIAVTDHFVMSDYSAIYGYNSRTKVVQLWHGVGFKAMGDGEKVLNTDVPGVQYSTDILTNNVHGIDAIRQRIRYILKAPVRELFEKYFMLVCPGKERVEAIGKIWNVPEEAYFMAGHPRNLPLYKKTLEKPVQKLILYAPTYRFSQNQEQRMVSLCIEAFPQIQELMEKIDGKFVIRLHPHTWRNYKNQINYHLSKYDRIEYDEEKDIYQVLGNYSVVISDYSSITLDFAMLDKPVIFYTFDYEWFCKNDAGFNLDFDANIPGPKTYTWEETLAKVEEYIENPQKDSDFRKERCRYFFDDRYNNQENSERICQEIKRRLKI